MELATLATAAVTYLVTSIKNSKGGAKASDELSTSIWKWIRPIFLKDEEPIKDLEQQPDSIDNQQEVFLKIKKYIEKYPEEKDNLKQLLEKVDSDTKNTLIQHHFGTGDNVGGNKIVNN